MLPDSSGSQARQARPLAPQALAALNEGRVVDAIRITRQIEGLDLRDAKLRVGLFIAGDPTYTHLKQPSVKEALGDFLADSWKAPVALGLGLGAFSLWITGELFPGLSKQIDVGILLTAGLAVPMIGAAVAWWFWARNWRVQREAARLAAVKAAAARPRFGGLPDPGAGSIQPMSVQASGEPERAGNSSTALPAAARDAIDRDDPITAIKILRAERGLGLAEAKAVVDAQLHNRRMRS